MSNQNDIYQSFTDVILTPTPTILGLKLHPYSLGMQIHLRNANSCFVGNNFFKLKDSQILCELILALFICSTDYDSFRVEYEQGQIPQLIADYVPSVRQAIQKQKESKDILNNDDLAKAIAGKVDLFIQYINKGTTTQQFVTLKKDKDGFEKPNPIDFEQIMLDALMTECKYTRQEALNLPMTETLSAFLLLGHKRECIEIESKEKWLLKRKKKGEPCPE